MPEKIKSKDPFDAQLWVFDLDGTLVDSLPIIADTLNRTRALHGAEPRPLPDVRRGIGAGSRVLVGKTCDDLVKTEDEISAFLGQFMEIYQTTSRTCPTIFDGVREIIDQLKSSPTHAIALWTNKPLAAVTPTLEVCGWANTFDIVVAPETTGTRKPDPTGLALIRQQTGFVDQRATMVGDSAFDFLAGRAGGASTVGVRCGYGDVGGDDQPDIWLDDPAQLLKRLRLR